MPQINRADDREVIQGARPFIRSIAAFLLYLRFGTPTTADAPENPSPRTYTIAKAHDQADTFLRVLDEDLGGE